MFFGREELIDQLTSLWKKRVSSLVTCRGRRRIGKSTLIEHFARKSSARFLKIEGRRPEKGMTNDSELEAFAKQLSDQCGCERTPPRDWSDAFRRLDRTLIVSASPYFRKSQPGREGVQVDLLLQTRKSICIVEIKRRKSIGREIADEMAEKCGRIARPRGVSLKTALIYEGELAPSVEADGYFDAVVPAARLLRM